MLRVRLFFPVLIVLAAAAAACGGGGGGSVVPSASPTPHAGPTTVPVGPTQQAIQLSGGGYTLSFYVPPVVTGSTATMSATLQTTLPTGTVAPQASKHASTAPRPPVAPNIGANVKGLAYLIVSTTAAVGFSAAPSFEYTLPSGTTIPAGQQTYLLFWDPAVAGTTGWVALLGPGAVNGQTVTFPSRQTGVNLNANTQYIYALAVTTAPVPTSTPAPTPTPTPAPTIAPTAAPLAGYCSNFTSSIPGGVPLRITDDSGTGGVLVAYVTETVNNVAYFVDNTGATHAAPFPLPAPCFSTTNGSSASVPLTIPPNAGGRIYFAYATPDPNPSSSTIPNPFGSATTTGGPGFGYSGASYPWDMVEYSTLNNGVVDTSQVAALGLPLELSVSASGTPMPHVPPGSCPTDSVPIVGITSCNFANVFTAIAQDPQYSALIYTANFNGKILDMQVVSPNNGASVTSFQWNVFGSFLPTPTPSVCPAPAPNGYLGCIVAAYQTQGRVFTSNVSGVSGVSGDYYCATSDGSSNILFKDIGASTSCSAPPKPGIAPNPFKMPVQNFMYGIPPAKDNGGAYGICKDDLLFSQPWGSADVGAGLLFASNDAFAMWKALTEDLNYGTALSISAIHPVQVTQANFSQILFQDPLSNNYDKIMHTYFNSGLAYGLPYDDTFKLESAVNFATGDSINVRVNAIPTAATATPVSAPVPYAPTPCPTLTPGIGSF